MHNLETLDAARLGSGEISGCHPLLEFDGEADKESDGHMFAMVSLFRGTKKHRSTAGPMIRAPLKNLEIGDRGLLDMNGRWNVPFSSCQLDDTSSNRVLDDNSELVSSLRQNQSPVVTVYIHLHRALGRKLPHTPSRRPSGLPRRPTIPLCSQ